jgi:hypothetical protein
MKLVCPLRIYSLVVIRASFGMFRDTILIASNIEHWDIIAMQISVLNVPDRCR